MRYLSKCCANCKYKSVVVRFGDINDGFVCDIANKKIDLFKDCCNKFEVSKQARLHLDNDGVVLSFKEIKELL